MLLLLIFVFLLSFARGQDCASCDNDCNVIQKASITDLCVGHLCIDGHPVPPGDGNPCTVEDIAENGDVVSVTIKDCCHIDEDCALFRPSACYTSECQHQGDNAYGWCKHTPIAGCCVDSGDCPSLPCFTASCGEECGNSELFFTESSGSPHKTPWMKRNINFATECKQCNQTRIEGCCLTHEECFHPERPNEISFCASNSCVCVPSQQVECTHATQAEDCAYLQPKLDNCPEDCASIECIHGYCVIEQNGNADNDHDGVLCPDDCDDHNSTISDFVWCAVDDTDTNFDRDAFLKCGTQAVRRCGVCLTGEIVVSRGNLTCPPEAPNGPCMVEFACDCCDHSASNVRPDHTICCHADCEIETSGDQVDECGGQPRHVCVTKPANVSKSIEEECQAWGAILQPQKPCDCTGDADCTNCWHAAESCPQDDQCATSTKKRDAPVCDECQNDPSATQANKDCFLDCDGDKQPVCPLDSGSPLDCCNALAGRTPTAYEHVTAGIQACCEAIIAASGEGGLAEDADPRTYNATSGVCTDLTTPMIPKQCSCPETGYVPRIDEQFPEGTDHLDYCDCTTDNIGDDFIVECGVDNDQDCAKSCDIVRVCSSKNPLAGPTGQVDACAAADHPAPPLGGEECDCNDDDATIHTPFGCFPDADADGYLNCKSCVSTCSVCPAGTSPVPYPIILAAEKAKVRVPLGGKAHLHNKRAEPECPPPAQYVPCPCTEQPVEVGESCSDPVPPPLINDKCDCCDLDRYAYPGSPHCSTQPRLCPDENGDPSYDYNCDDDDDHLVLCEDHGAEEDGEDQIIIDDVNERYIRFCQQHNHSTTNSEGIYVNYETSGECSYNATSGNCTTNHGFCLERKRSVGDKIELQGKRGSGDGHVQVDAPIECDQMSIVDGEDPTDGGLQPGECFEYLEDCHARHHGNSTTTCHCDCDICVLVGQ